MSEMVLFFIKTYLPFHTVPKRASQLDKRATLQALATRWSSEDVEVFGVQ